MEEEIMTRNHNQKKKVTINPTLTIMSCLTTPGHKSNLVRFKYAAHQLPFNIRFMRKSQKAFLVSFGHGSIFFSAI